MVNAETLALIKKYEQCRLRAFIPVPGDPYTIGWGHTGPDVVAGLLWSQDQADAQLLKDLSRAEEIVQNAVMVDLTENQYGALVSFAYNVGPGHPGGKDGLVYLSSGHPSTLLVLVNKGNFADAADEFPKWDKAHGVELNGLKARRADERALFLKGD